MPSTPASSTRPLGTLTVDEVANLFVHLNKPEYAATFEEFECDGASLASIKSVDEILEVMGAGMTKFQAKILLKDLKDFAREGVAVALLSPPHGSGDVLHAGEQPGDGVLPGGEWRKDVGLSSSAVTGQAGGRVPPTTTTTATATAAATATATAAATATATAAATTPATTTTTTATTTQPPTRALDRDPTAPYYTPLSGGRPLLDSDAQDLAADLSAECKTRPHRRMNGAELGRFVETHARWKDREGEV